MLKIKYIVHLKIIYIYILRIRLKLRNQNNFGILCCKVSVLVHKIKKTVLYMVKVFTKI